MAQQVTVGQEVAIMNGYGAGRVTFGFTVAKVTRTGQVVINVKNIDSTTRERRFDADGYEMGSQSSRWNRDRLIVDVATARAHEAQKLASNTAAALLNEVKPEYMRGTYGKESMLKIVADLQAKLDAARAAVEAI